ncbi:hypothetical protein OROGR_031429 [Orobanche gracilis]
MENNRRNNNNYVSSQQSRGGVASTSTGSRYPPGFRFMPTDEELIVYYLRKKVNNEPIPIAEINEVNIYRFTPNYLKDNYPRSGNNEWYFFTPRDRRYPNGDRPKRSVEGVGWWKATGGDKPIRSRGKIVGMKKVLVFYFGKNKSEEEKTNWIMHEYKLSTSSTSPRNNNMRLDDWVICRIYDRACKLNKKINDVDDRAPLDVEQGSSPLVMQPSEDNNNNIEDVQPLQIQNDNSSVAFDQNHNHYDQGPMLMIANRYGQNLHQVPTNYNYQDGFNQLLPGLMPESAHLYDMNNFNCGMPYAHRHQYFPSEEHLTWQGEFQQEHVTWQGEFQQEHLTLQGEFEQNHRANIHQLDYPSNTLSTLSVDDYLTPGEEDFGLYGVLI